MKRLLAVALVGGFVLGAMSASAQLTSDSPTGTLKGKVVDIVKFITNKSNATEADADANALSDWVVADDAFSSTDGGAYQRFTETQAVFRLVMNTNVTLTTNSVTPLTQYDDAGLSTEGATGETLATFYNLSTDGVGVAGTETTFTGNSWTGITAAEAAAKAASGVGGDGLGVGTEFNFVYVGGATPAATTGNTNIDATVQDLRAPANAAAQTDALAKYYIGGATANAEWTAVQTIPVPVGTFLQNGVTVTHVPRDGAVLIIVRCRGLNGEDFGNDSDLSEAPDIGYYESTIVLTATAL
jgi:hypothetical protein